MSSFALTAVEVLLAIGLGIVAVCVALKFLHWLFVMLCILGKNMIEGGTDVLIGLARMLARAMGVASMWLLRMLWELFKIAVLWMAVPVRQWLSALMTAFREHCKLRVLYWKYGHREFASFRAFRRHMLGEEGDSDSGTGDSQESGPGTATPRSRYQEALELLGFAADQALTLAMLKARHRQLIGMVHPDKGCPTGAFAQQINDAVNVIKQERKWR